MQKHKLSILITSILCLSANLQAEEIETRSVEVTATKTVKNLLDVPTSVSVITSEEIAKSGKSTVGDILKDIPGILVNNDGSQGLKRVSIRGEDCFRTLVLIDGQKISEHKSMSGAAILIAPSQIERIEVIKGASSVLYGSDSIGGVINIITKKGSKKPVGGDLGVSWDSSANGWTEYGSVGGTVNDFHYRVGLSNTDFGNLHTPAGTAYGTDYNQKSMDAYFAYDILNNFTIGVNGDYFDSNIKSVSEGTEDFYVRIPKWERYKANLFLEAKELNEYFAKIRFDAYYQKNEKNMNNHVGSANMNSFADNEIRTFGTALQTEFALGENHYLIWGAEYSKDRLEAQNKLSVAPSPMISVNQNTHLEGSQVSFASFLSMESQIFSELLLSYGLRYTYVKNEVDKYDGSGTMTMSGRTSPYSPSVQTGSDSDDRVVFNAGLVWRPTSDTAFRANWGQGFRAPILQERYVITSMGGTSVYGNPDLDPETSNNYELGFRWAANKGVADVAVFFNDADNYITTVKRDKITIYDNIASVKTYGVELALNYDFDIGLTPYTQTTFMRRQFNNPQTVGKTWNSNIPALMSRYGVQYLYDFGSLKLTSDVYGITHSKRKSDYLSNGQVETDTYGSFTTANLDLGLLFGSEDQYKINASFLNINDKKYYLTDALAEPGFHTVISFNASF